MTEDAPPIAVQQVESVSFDGIVQNNIDSDQEQAVVHVYGFPFIFDNGTNAATVCETAYNKFTEFVAAENISQKLTAKVLMVPSLNVDLLIVFPHPGNKYLRKRVFVKSKLIDVACKKWLWFMG
ncbi:baseplate wedge subunit tail pin [Klebsiella phage CPRSB]|nr:baseplate wedge subunit tail pin [Klebsiella phage CPRSB]